MTEEWTDFNHHDPGITVLQMYAWLTDMLDYYMSATGDVHVEKYLKLLGVEPKEGCPAGGYVVVEGLPEGTVLPQVPDFWLERFPMKRSGIMKCGKTGLSHFSMRQMECLRI